MTANGLLPFTFALLALAVCKPTEDVIGDELVSLELPGLTLSVPPGRTEPPDKGWYVGQAFSRPKAGGYVQVSWRKVDDAGGSVDLELALKRVARSLDEDLGVSDLGPTTVSGHRAVTAKIALTASLSGHLTTWLCPDDRRMHHVLIVGPARRIYDKILASVTCHTWPPNRRATSLDLPHFEPPAGFTQVEPEQDGTAKWTRGDETLVLGFGLPSRPNAVLQATRDQFPPGLQDIEESTLVGPDQKPRARITGRLQDKNAEWRFTYDLLDCSDRGVVYLATHYAPTALKASKPPVLDAVRCPTASP